MAFLGTLSLLSLFILLKYTHIKELKKDDEGYHYDEWTTTPAAGGGEPPATGESS